MIRLSKDRVLLLHKLMAEVTGGQRRTAGGSPFGCGPGGNFRHL